VHPPADAKGLRRQEDVLADDGRLVNARYLMDRHPPSLGQTVAAEFMRQGHFAGHIRRVRLAYRDQRDALVSELRRIGADGVTVDAPDQGKHLIAYLDRGLSDVAVEQAAYRRGVVVRAISRMYRKAPPRSGLLLGFTGYAIEAIVSAAASLAAVIGERPARAIARATRPVAGPSRRSNGGAPGSSRGATP
jgi:DNA-binding transcriptional MocR family regulator